MKSVAAGPLRAEVLRRGCERVFWVSGESVPKRSLAPVRDGVCTVRKWDFEVLHRCERLFQDTLARDPKHPLALSPKHFWSICLIWQLYQGARLATLEVNGISNLHAPFKLVRIDYPKITAALALFNIFELDFLAGCNGKGVIVWLFWIKFPGRVYW